MKLRDWLPVVSHFVLAGAAVLMPTASTLLAQQTDDRRPPPEAAEQEESRRLVHQLYGAEFAQASDAAQWRALAKKLLEQALATTGDPTGRYVLLQTAADTALKAGDTAVAFEAVDVMAEEFQIRGVAAKADILREFAKRVRSKIENRALAATTAEIIDEAVADDEYELAERLLEMATRAARKARDGDLVRQLAARREEVEESAETYQAVKRALAKLARQPVDPEANKTVGEYYCFGKHDWERGLPMLALSDDAALKPLAVREVEKVSSPPAMVQLAEEWAKASESREGPEKRAILGRAIHWYERALPRLSGLSKLKAQQRIQELRRMLASAEDVVSFHLVATIDGSDTLEIFPSHVKWTHHKWSWPKSVILNGAAWDPKKSPLLPYPKALGAVLSRVDFNSARHEKIRGRGRVRLEKSVDGVVVHVYDGAGGSDTYEIIVMLKRLDR